MEVELKIIAADGTVRTVVVRPGEAVVIQPGETIVLTPASTLAITPNQDGNDLVLATPEGEIRIVGFVADEAEAELPAAIAYLDASGFILITNKGTIVSTPITVPAFEHIVLPENEPLPESLLVFDDALRNAALLDILTGNESTSESTPLNTAEAGSEPNLDAIEIFAGSLDQGPSNFTLSTAEATAREGDSITVSITRSGNLSGTDTIDFETLIRSGDAAGGTTGADFAAQSGQATFLPGETVKTITIPLTADAPSAEAPETFAFRISNAVTSRAAGTTVVENNLVELTIISNDPPINSVPGAQATNEDIALVFTGGTAITVSDADGDRLEVNLSVDRGTLTLGALPGGVQVQGNGSGEITMSGNAAALNAALNGLQYRPASNFFGTDTLVIRSDDGVAVDTDSFAITVNAVNDAPIIAATATPVLTAIAEDAGAPSGAVGTAVATLIEAAGGGGLNNFSDVDGPAMGIAVTFLDSSNGDWFYSINNGASWDPVAGLSNASSLLLSATGGRLYFQPGGADFSGTINSAVVFRAWDQSSGVNGTLADTTVNNGATAFSANTDNANLTVSNINDAPVLNVAATPVLADTDENAGAPSGAVGTTVASLVANGSGIDNVTDPDGPNLGIAVTDLDTTNGQWWFSTNNGTSWTLVGAVAPNNALLLSGTGGRLFFEPTTAGFNGTITDALSFRAWDQASGATGGRANTTVNGSPTAFSTAIDTADVTVVAFNDPPQNSQPGPQSVGEDAPLTFTGATLISVADSDAGANPLNVTLSVNTGTLALAGTTGLTGDTDGSDGSISVSGTIVDLNNALDGLVYQGLAGFSGTDTLTITTNDQGSVGNDPGTSGGPSDEQDLTTVAITVLGQNDTPLLNNAATPVLAAVNEDAGPAAGAVGTAVSSLVDSNAVVGGLDNITDPDGPVAGIAITALDATNGAWFFSINNGTNWTPVGAVSETNALLLSGTNGRIYFRPTTANFSGNIANAMSFKAWDGATNATFTGTNGTKFDTTIVAPESPFSVDTDTAAIAVTAVNDAPLNTFPGAQAATEDTPLTFTGPSQISVADVDLGAGSLTVSLAVSNGTLALSGTTGLTGDTNGADGTISVSGTVASLNTALNGLTYQGLFGFSGADTLTITTDDQGNTGAGGAQQDVDTIAINVTGVNNTPVLNNAATPLLTAVNEDSGVPSGAVGTTIASLADLSTALGGLDNVTDPDGPLAGVAITALDASNGTWWFSINNGTNWNPVGAVAANSALLLSATDGRLYFQPNGNFSGAVANAVTFKAWDGFTNGTFTGTNGSKADSTIVAAENPFSTITDTANLTVSAINDAPTNFVPGARSVAEDAPLVFTGATAISATDVDAGANPLTVTLSVNDGTLSLSGVAGLTGDTDGSDGTIAVSGLLADLNAALNGLTYQGTTDFSGADVLTITTNDQGNVGADPGFTGGASDEQDVDTVAITILGNNDSPSLNAGATPVLAAVNEDAPAPSGAIGTTVASLIDTVGGGGLDNLSDPDGPNAGIAITALNTANGTWWFSTNNGTNWSAVGAVSDASALLLSATNGRLYFQPTTAHFNGTIANAVTFRAWDQSTGGNGSKVNTTTNGGVTAFSSTTDTAEVSVSAVNDAPVNTRPGAQSVAEDAQLVFGAANAISVADVDALGNPLTVTLGVNNGTLTLASVTGLTGDTNGADGSISVSGTLANLNAALNGLSYQGLLGFSGADTLTITTNDQGNTGTPGALQDVDTVAITVVGVNNTPVLNPLATPALVNLNEDAGAPSGVVGTAVASLVDLSTAVGGLDNVTDPDGPLTGIAITNLDTSNGTWWFSINNGTNWSLVGGVAANNALLLSAANGRLYYQPNANSSGTIANAVTFKAWDGFTNGTFTGINGGKADTTVVGAQNPFSTSTDTAGITVDSINDSPVNTRPGAQTVAEDATLTFTGANAISVADVDAGTNPVTLSLSVTNGTLTLSGVAGLTGDTDGSDGSLSVNGTVADLNAALNGLVYQGTTDYSGPDTLTITTNDGGASGSGGPLQDVDTVAITVTGNNDAPSLSPAVTPVLAAVNEDAGLPVGAVGTTVASLVDLSSAVGGLDNVTDPDGPNLGIAVTGLNTANGTWWFSINNGTTWALVGAVSNTNALLLATANARLYFQPTTANFNGTVTDALTFRAWDRSTGTNGTKVSTATNGGTSAFSSATDTADVTVTAVNDAPVNTRPGAQTVAEDNPLAFTGGTAISVADLDVGGGSLTVTLSVTNGALALSGTAGLTGDTDGSDGNLSVSGSVADLNTALNGLTYLGSTGFSGADTLTITTDDGGASGSGGSLQDVDTVAITVTGVNSTPILSPAATPVLVTVNEDPGVPSGAVGTAVSSLVDLSTVVGGLDNVTDPDGPLTGVAITNLDTSNGTWWFSINDGTTWNLVGTVSATNALLLSGTNGRLYYQPNLNFNGTVTDAVTFKAWDGFTTGTFTGTNGTKANTTLVGAENPFSVATDTADITVDALNDAPVNTRPGAQSVAEDASLVFTGANQISVADVDAGANPLTVSLSVTNGTLALSGTAGLTGDTNGADGTLSVSGTAADLNLALNNLTYAGLADFSGATTLTITTSDGGASGAGGALQDVDTVAITVTGDNDSPTLTAAATPLLAAIDEDAPAPVGAIGTTVASLIDSSAVVGGLDNATDPDGPNLGIAITGLNTSNGTWWFSTNNGTNWNLVGAVSNSSALLLSGTNGRLYFQPTTANFNGTVTDAVTFRAWDQFTGANGTKVTTAANGGNTAFSTATDTADITVNSLNDSPVNTRPGAQTVAEDATLTFTGANVISVADADAGSNPITVSLSVTNGTLALSGVAGLTGDTDGSDGAISINGLIADLNTALNGLAYQGLTDFSGAATLTITTNDGGASGTGGALQDVDTVAITVTGNNDSPVLNAAATPVLVAVNEDAPAPSGVVGTTVASLVDAAGGGGLDNVTDPDGPNLGIAITGLNAANGTWWFSINNGTTWSLVGAVSGTNALQLATSNGRLYYQPNLNFSGTVTDAVTFRAWDRFAGTNGTKINPGAGGGTSAYSAATDTADITVNSLNDAPVNTRPGAQTVAEDATLTFTGANAISVADVDAGSAPVTMSLSVTNGTLALSGVAGLTGDTDGSDGTISVNGTIADLNTALNGLTYQGLTDFSGASTLTITTNDGGASGSGGALQDVDTVAITVTGNNDAPVLNATATPVLGAVNEDAAAPAGVVGTTVASLIDSSAVVGGLDNATDPDGPNLGVAVTGLDTANGTWWFSINNGTTWALVGAVSNTSALLLSGTNGRLYYQPTTANFNGTVTDAVTFRAWDQFTGTNGTKVTTAVNGGNTAFSSATDTADISVSAVNDAPVNTRPGAQTVAEDNPLVFTGGNAISVADVDAGGNSLTVSLSVTNGTLALSGVAGLTGDTDGSDGTLSVSGSLADLNSALNGLSYQGLLGFSGPDTLTITTNDQGNTGTGGALADADTVAITVTGVNNTPSLNNAATPVLVTVNEDPGVPSGVVGTAVSSLVDLSTALGGLDNVTDPDGPLTGVAITNLDTSNGTWWFSTNDGATWSLVGAVSDTSALLLSATNGRLYYQPNLNFNGTVTDAVTFKAWDGFTNGTFTGTNGTKANTTLVGAENPFSTVTDTANVTVNSVNDAPVNTRPGAQTITEDTPLVFTGGTAISVADVDAGANPLTVSLSVTNGTLALSGTAGLTGDTDGSDGTLSVSGSLADLNTALNGLAYQGLTGFSGASTLTITTSDGGASGSGGSLQDVDTVAITVTGVNNTPSLNNAATPVLVSLNEDAGAPVGAVGTTVASLVDLDSAVGGLDNVTDPDGPLTGIAITGLDTTNGTWWFSTNNGTAWNLVGAVAETSALLLSATNGRLYYQPNANFNGLVTGAVTFKAWDGFTNATFTGTNGTKANTTLVGAEKPFSTATDVANITVNSLNDAPVNTRPGAQTVAEDATLTFTGANAISVADVDAGGDPVTVSLSVTNGSLALSGVAGLTGDTDGSDGTISVNGTVAALNTALNGLTYQGLTDFSGASTLTITTNDGGASGSGGALQDVDTVAITVTGNNDAPVLNATATPVLGAVNEDAAAPVGVVGTTVASLIDSSAVVGGLDNATDPDGPNLGVAVTGLDTANGTWWFSINNGTTWALVGAVSNTSALLLSGTNGRLYYQPNLNFSGTVSGAVTFRAWDQFSGANGTKVTTAVNGGNTAFSSATDTADINVSAVNDAPVNTRPGAQTVAEDATLTFTGANAISVADVDAGGDPVTVSLSVTNGTLALSGVAGLTGDTDGSDGTISVNGTVAALNTALNGLTYQGLSNFSGASTLTITTNDGGATGSGGALQDVDTVAITVTGNNDAPVLNATATPVLGAVNEDAAAPAGVVGTTVASLIDSSAVVGGLDNATDPDGPNLGVAVTGLDTANGTWWFSINNGTTWALVGAVSNTSALLLSGTNGRLYYQPNLNFSGTVSGAVTFRAWDQFTGTNGTKVTTAVNGGNTAFSSATDTADISVSAVNDAPVNTRPGAQTVAEDATLTFTGANAISVADVDAGANPLTVSLSVTNGTLALSGVAGLTGDTDGSDGTISVNGTVAALNTALNGLTYQGLSNFSGASTLTITTNDGGASGSGGALQDVDTVAITVTGDNDSPLLNTGASPVLTPVNEDAGTPSGVVGTAVSALIANGSGIDNASDADGPNLGIAITDLAATNGTWWFSINNGTTWTLVGAVAETTALLLSSTNGRLYFQPNSNFNGNVSDAVTFKAWDQFTGTNGTKVDTTLVDPESAFSADSDTANIIVNAVNDAPVNTRPGAQSAVEDTPLTFTGGTLISVADVDAGTSQLTVSLSVTNGTLQLSGLTGLTGDTNGSDGTLSVSGTLVDLNAALNGLIYLGSAGFSGADTLTITTNDQGNTGTGGALADVDTVAITVAGSNNTPQLNDAATPVLVSVNEDPGVPSGSLVGTAVSSLVDLSTVVGGHDNVTDPDGPLTGIAITNLDTSNGTWWFSINNGTTWSLVGAVSATNALLLSGTNGRLYYQPNLNFNGTVSDAVTFKAWDGFTNATFTGTNGTKANSTIAGAQNPFSLDTDTANITVDAVNDAPVNTRPGAQSVAEDVALVFNTANGNVISVNDVDLGAADLAMTLNVTNGTLTLGSIVGLSNLVGNSTGTVTFNGTIAEVNTALQGLSFLGNSNFSGTSTLTITTNDGGATGSGGAQQDSDTVTITVTGNNDAPVLVTGATPVMAAVNEDSAAPSGAVGTSVASLIDSSAVVGGLDNATDADGPNLGIAVTSLDTDNGTWWFSTNNGTSWSLVGAVSNTSALLLSTTNGRLYFQSTAANFNGTITDAVTFRAWDQFTGTNGTKVTTAVNGGNTAFSSQTDTADITVNAVNDAPVNTRPATASTAEDVALVFSTANGNAISVTDIDLLAADLAMTLSVTNGTLTLGSIVGLSNLVGNGSGTVTFNGTIAEVNAALQGLSFLGNPNFSGASTLTITTNDGGATGSGGALQDVDTVAITVTGANDAPTLNVGATPVLQAVNEDAAAPVGTVGTTIASLVDLSSVGGGLDNVTDPDSATIGMAVTGLDSSNGTWRFSINNGTTWTLVGAVSETNALLLSATNGRLHFQPNADFNGTVANAVTFVAWDQSTGTNGTKVNPGAGGGTSAFSAIASPDTAAVTVNAVNDAPVNTRPGAQSIGESLPLTFNAANANVISVNDVDLGAADLAMTLNVTNGTLNLGSIVGLSNLLGNGTGTVTFNGTIGEVNTALTNLIFQGAAGFSGVSTLTITTNDGGASGSGGALQDVDTVTITVVGTNDAPVLNNALTPILGNATENAPAPVGAVGTAITSLVDLLGGGGVNNVTDPDGPAQGVAITALNTSQGQWWFSTNNGSTWSLVGAVSNASALLLAASTGRIYFDAGAFTGTITDAVTFRAWDTSSGVNGTKVDTSLNGGASAFSISTDTANITVDAGAPVGFNALIDLSALNGTNGIKLAGTLSTAGVGKAISLVNDLNGDGFDDIVIAADGLNIVNLFFGATTATLDTLNQVDNSGFDLGTTQNGQTAVVMNGPVFADHISSSVATADLNGDGLYDAVFGDFDFTNPQATHIVRGTTAAAFDQLNGNGSAANDAGFTVSTLTGGGGANGATLVASSTVSGALRTAVAVGAGDFDGDGRDDLMVGQGRYISGVANTDGITRVVFGDDFTDLAALNPLTGNNGDGAGGVVDAVISFRGVTNAHWATGFSVASAGDINGDGFDDMVLGSRYGAGATGTARSYVIFGGSRASLETLATNIATPALYPSGLGSLNGANGGFAVSSTFFFGALSLGFSVSSAGDFNGDGLDDLLIGAPNEFASGGDMTAVIFGKTTGFTNLELSTQLTAAPGAGTAFLNNGFLINGGTFAQGEGRSVSSAGDVNGDGYDDILIGATAGSGLSYILFGRPDVANILSDVAAFGSFPAMQAVQPGALGANFNDVADPFNVYAAGMILDSPNQGGNGLVSGGGDINGDGFDDVLVGAPASPVSGAGLAGHGYVVYGKDFVGTGDFAAGLTASANGQTVLGSTAGETLSSASHSAIVHRGGAGNDFIKVNMTEFDVDGGGDTATDKASIAAGSGDTLGLAVTGGLDLDFTALLASGARESAQYSGIERIDLSDTGNGIVSGANTVTLNVRDLLDMSGDSHTLAILGDSGDTLVASGGWTSSGMVGTFNQYIIAGSAATLLVDPDIVGSAGTLIT